MEEIMIEEYRESTKPAGYVCLKWSDERSEYCVDVISTRKTYRRQGVAAALMEQARAKLGYYPAPEVILPNPDARAFWARYGHESGFNAALQAEYNNWN